MGSPFDRVLEDRCGSWAPATMRERDSNVIKSYRIYVAEVLRRDSKGAETPSIFDREYNEQGHEIRKSFVTNEAVSYSVPPFKPSKNAGGKLVETAPFLALARSAALMKIEELMLMCHLESNRRRT